jgi:hypothetical protein
MLTKFYSFKKWVLHQHCVEERGVRSGIHRAFLQQKERYARG